ncbi:unnamed protein product [Triticum turgidum subsp. durum]|uniref:Uncharacterized protein n=1 Tax=Triticum turgidum subsp. durum TaxID=4567 RepID=A0A9R1RN51_TRITD|nr:unnamed protein product [Triticum turgidum subsp. durum]
MGQIQWKLPVVASLEASRTTASSIVYSFDLCSRSRTGRGTSSTATRRTARSNARFLIHTFRHNLEWRLVENMTVCGSIAEKQAQIFTEECKPFPEDVQIQSIYPCASASNLMLLSYKVQISSNHIITKWSDIAELELKLS